MTEQLRRQLTHIMQKTSGSLPDDMQEIGTDDASERQWRDNHAAGRLQWQSAHQEASLGLMALRLGNTEAASKCLLTAMWCYISALEKQIRPKGLRALDRVSQKRGRRRNVD